MRLRRSGSVDVVPWWAIASAATAPLVLIASWSLSGALQPTGYRPLRQTISVLAGPAASHRWIVTVGLLGVGTCYLVTALGLTGLCAAARVLLVVAGVAAVGLASSPVPVRGSTPSHVAWTVVGAATMTVWPATVRHRAPPQPPIPSLGSAAIVTVMLLALLGWTLVETQRGEFLGLAERLSTAVQTTWPLVVAVALRRANGSGDRDVRRFGFASGAVR